MASVMEVVNTCVAHVNKALFVADTNTITVDGTSCTRKTATLAATGRPVTKVQRHTNAKNANTFGPAMIGYVMAGMVNQSIDTRAKFNDRSPLNVIEWHLLWKLMDLYVSRFGNVRPDPEAVPHMAGYLDEFRRVFNCLRSWYVYKHFRARLNAVAFIDSNVDRCDRTHLTRNEGSDAQRASWLFYTPLQNLMYQILYPQAYIDMDWFDNADTDVVVAGVSAFLNDLLSHVTGRGNRDSSPPIIFRLTPPVVAIDGHDFTLHNATAHVYRSVGRAGVRVITGASASFDVDTVPDYVAVRNVKGPHGEAWSKAAGYKPVGAPTHGGSSPSPQPPTDGRVEEETDLDSMFSAID